MGNWWENPRLADPETRRQDWEAGGRYDPTGSGGGAPVAPVAPAAPSGGGGGQTAPPAPTWETAKGEVTDSGLTVEQLFALQYPYGNIQKIWEQQNAAAGAPPAPPAPPQGLAPIAPGQSRPVRPVTDVSAPVAPAITTVAPTVTAAGERQRVNPLTGAVQTMADEDYANLVAQAAELKRQQQVKEGQGQEKLDIERLAAEGQRAYQDAMAKYNNAQLAQAASDAAMRAEMTRQANAIAQSNAVATAAYQQGLIQNQAVLAANQQREIQQTRRQRRPNRPPRISVA